MKIRELLSDESKWVASGSLAADSSGNPIGVYSVDAARWCLLGAAYYCYRDQQELFTVTRQIREAIGSGGIGGWNDRHTFDDVKALVNRLDI